MYSYVCSKNSRYERTMIYTAIIVFIAVRINLRFLKYFYLYLKKCLTEIKFALIFQKKCGTKDFFKEKLLLCNVCK